MKRKNHQILRTNLVTTATAVLVAISSWLCGQSTAKAQTSPTVANVYPNGTNLFQPSTTFSFTVASSVGVTNVTVALTTTTLSGSLSYLQNLTAANGLTITGPNTSETVSTPLKSNTLYSATISASDANGRSTSANYSFDTISPSYTLEAEDWDYNGGQFIDNPQTNAYAGLASTAGVDFNNPDYNNGTGGGPSDGGAAYRPQGLETEINGDVPRLAYIGTTNVDYDVGFNNGGNWGNYTRHYPPGVYNVYVRASDGNGAQTDAGDISVFAGTASFAVPGTNFFSVQSTGWQTYDFYPLVDSGNNLAILTIPNDGTASTLRLTIDGGNCNENFFMLVPANTIVTAVTASITNVYPDGTVLFQPASALTFTANSTNGIDPGNILVRFGVTNLLGQGYTTNITTANGMTVTGTSTSRNVRVPLESNMTYTAFIQVIDGAGNPASRNFTFDTMNPAYTFDAEDFDYGGGQFFDNPQTNAYYGLDSDEFIDILVATNNQHSFAYRGVANPNGGPTALNNEPCGDTPRAAYTNANALNPITGLPYVDYDVGFNSGGDWGDYTRHYPAGSYNIYMRGANGGINGGGNVGAGTASLSLLTAGYATANQTVTTLGTFTIYSTGNWQKYTWVPLKDIYGNLAKLTFDGSMQTLRVTTLGLPSGGSYNANFYMLMPAVVNLPTIESIYPNGTSFFQATNKLSFIVTSGTPILTNNIVVSLNGTNATGLSFAATTSGWIVNTPLQLNSAYTAAITVTDNDGQVASSSVSFDTFQSTDYQFEAADYDYTSNNVSGLFFDNPQVDAYINTGGSNGVDILESDPNAFSRGYSYRTNNGADFPDGAADDLPRAKFTAVGATDYSIGSFGPGSWANYTRHYPAGTYNVWERYAEGGNLTASTLSKVTSGYATSSQTTSLLGIFTNVVGGWSLWTWAPLVDTNGNLARVTFDGSQTTLQLGGSPVGTQPEVNVHFFLLAPVTISSGLVTLTASIGGGHINISFPTQSGHTYQLLYTTDLIGSSWSTVGSPVTGDGSTNTVTDTLNGGSRFFRLQIQ